MPQRGRPQTTPGARSSGRPIRPLGRGRKPQLPDVPAKATKPLAQMSQEERRQYNAAQKRRSRQRAKQELSERAAEILYSASLHPRPLSYEAPMLRVFAPDNETAQRYGGPDAVAVQKITLTIPRDLWRQTRNAAHFLRSQGLPIDAATIMCMHLENMLNGLQNTLNDGEPFPAPEIASPAPSIFKAPPKTAPKT